MWCGLSALSVGTSCAKTAELIKMVFGLCTHGGPGNHVLDVRTIQDTPPQGALLGGHAWACSDLAAVDILSVIH